MARGRKANGQFTKGGGGKPRRRAASTAGSARRKAASRAIPVEDVVAGGLIVAGVALPMGGETPASRVLAGDYSGAINDAYNRIPYPAGLGDQMNQGALLVAAGIAAKAGGWAARKLGHRSKHTVKLSRKFHLKL